MLELDSLTRAEADEIGLLLKDASARREHGVFVIEGPHLLEEALLSRRAEVVKVAVTHAAYEKHEELLSKIERDLFTLPAKLAEKLSDTKSPQGIFAVVRLKTDVSEPSHELILALDGVQDPGNVGTIIRTAAWFGVGRVILGEGSADPFSPKVVRATQGAIFNVTTDYVGDLIKELERLRKNWYRLCVSSLSSTAKSIYDMEFREKSVIVIGSEARGVQEALVRMADDVVVVPRAGKYGESLNAAVSAGVILSEVTRQTT